MEDQSQSSQSASTAVSESNIPQATTTTQEDLEPLNMFILSTALSLLSIDREKLNQQLRQEKNQQVLQQYVSESRVKVLVVSMLEDETVNLFSEISQQACAQAHSIALVKRPAFQVGANMNPTHFSSMVQILNLGYLRNGATPMQINQLYVENCFIPIFNVFRTANEQGSLVGSGGSNSSSTVYINATDRDSYNLMLKRLNDFNLALIQCQQSVEVQEIQLEIPRKLRERVTEVRVSQQRAASEEDFLDLMESEEFQDSLSQCVKKWTQDINNVTKIQYDVSHGTTLQEINFWISYEKSLNMINLQLNSIEVDLTLRLLEKKQKFQVNAFRFELNFKKQLKLCTACNAFTKDFPLHELLSALTMDDIIKALNLIFQHMKKIQNNQEYTTERAIKLLEAISRDLNQQIVKILRQQQSFNLMSMPYAQFKVLCGQCEGVLKKWDQDYSTFSMMIVKKKHNNEGYYEHIVYIKKRLQQIQTIRMMHNKLETVIQKIVQKERREKKRPNSSSVDTLFLHFNNDDITYAYQLFVELDVLDFSPQGENNLKEAEKQYNQRIDKVESMITAQLRDKLGAAQNAKEMLLIFSKFSALLLRPRIKCAIQEYQTQLLRTLYKDMQSLHDKFLRRYQGSENALLSEERDFPTTSGQMIWAQQIQNKLDKYNERVQSILGEDFRQHPEGKKCDEFYQQFKQKINLPRLKETWTKSSQEILGRINSSERLFDVVQRKKLELIVNFDQTKIQVFKEYKIVNQMGLKIQMSMNFVMDDLKQSYPFAVSLQESIHQYQQIMARIQDEKMLMLVANNQFEIQQTLLQGAASSWQYQKQNIGQYAKRLQDKVMALEEAVNGLLEKYDQIQAILATLHTCPTDDPLTLRQRLQDIQKVIDEFCMKNYSNLHVWVPEVDMRIEEIFIERLHQSITLWLERFEKCPRNDPSSKTHELKLRDQIIYIDPPIEYARYYWLSQFHQQIGVICCLPRLEANRYDQGVLKDQDQRQTDYFGLLQKDNKAREALHKAYERIDSVILSAEKYVQTWLSYQSLWLIEPRRIYDSLGENIKKWQQLLNEIKQGRSTFDNSETDIMFGPIIIDYRLVQAKINNKYDSWHKDILSHFGEQLLVKLRVFFKMIMGARMRLELVNFLQPQVSQGPGSSSIVGVSSSGAGSQSTAASDILSSIKEVSELKEKHPFWNEEMESFRRAQQLLERQRFTYPSDWLYMEQMEGEWSTFTQLMKRKWQQFENETSAMQQKVLAEELIIGEKIREVKEQWAQQRPNSGLGAPQKALEYLNMAEGQAQRVMEAHKRCCACKALLSMEPGNPGELDDLVMEIGDCRKLWQEMAHAWEFIAELSESSVAASSNAKIKEGPEKALEFLQALPHKFKTQEAYVQMRDRIKNIQKMNKIITNLKSEAMKQRHWKELLRKLKVVLLGQQQELLMQQLWDIDLLRNEKIIEDVLNVARGELVLEEMLRTIKERWAKHELELVKYQSRGCKLIKGWDDLFTQLDEDLSNLSSMKISPYYKTFEEEIVPWDEKLQRIRLILDSWIDVQRRWVYLESIFNGGSSDIRTQLANEFNRFKSIDNEFTSLMKKVATKPQFLEVMVIPGLQKTLERLGDLLAKIQKALGDYLEMQRTAFARFYFVGDEDLLEIIGNSKDVKNVQRHFTKMYAGIVSLEAEGSSAGTSSTVTGMNSREGESVRFEKPVSLGEEPRINVWLGQVDEQMCVTLASLLEVSLKQIAALEGGSGSNQEVGNGSSSSDEQLVQIIENFPAQIVLLALQVVWCQRVECALPSQKLEDVVQQIVRFLSVLAENIAKDLRKDLRQKFEQIITDFVHQRDVTRVLLQGGVKSSRDFSWQYHMRFNWVPPTSTTSTSVISSEEGSQQQSGNNPILRRLVIQMANASFEYGFEYLGVGEKLVQTPLTDKCYLTLTQALHLRLGGSPFGPAGTGKTESVKALGAQLGRFVLVFNCDETFDFQAMGRIFVGLCQVGAWGCFDEFNRLEERMLSAVSQQILVIQSGLRERQHKIDLLNREVRLNPIMGIFVTMNPGYAGRSNLPENLKQLFRQMAMVKPDRDLIAQVMLYSQGYRTAERLAGKIVSLFELCSDQLSTQPHYDFGLRALKSVLVSAGNMKRQEILEGNNINSNNSSSEQLQAFEQKILLRSVCETIVPKLVAEDVPLLANLLAGVFPGSQLMQIQEDKLRAQILRVAEQRNYTRSDEFVQKLLQLYQIQRLHHGVMMVGPSGAGKSAAWRVLLEAMYLTDHKKGESYVIDPKAITKDELYGKLDNTTMEWTDGIFTSILRKITENVRGESQRRHWIIFDGDVDPEWAENLNSVLDDNKLLTLPNGERIAIPPNVRIMFEVETLRYATLATVSRCGMVWFSDDIVTSRMVFHHYLARLKQDNYDEVPKVDFDDKPQQPQQKQQRVRPDDVLRQQCVEAIFPFFFVPQNQQSIQATATTASTNISFIESCLNAATQRKHVMEFTKIRALESMFALIRKGISNVLDYNESHGDLPMEPKALKSYMRCWTLFAVLWGIAGSMSISERLIYSEDIAKYAIGLFLDEDHLFPPSSLGAPLLDCELRLDDQNWHLWKKRVPSVEIDPMKVTDADLIITTVDTLRHQEVLCSWLSEHRPFLLCGPPGSGKTMTLMSTLKQLTDFEMIFVNFSSSTTPALIMKQFDHYCEYVKTTGGFVLRPKQPNKWLVVFCDEINLPDSDKYGTIVVITFLRQLTEQRGFWRPHDKQWISLERIQFVGACNPPTDVGRKPLSARFLRHTPLMLVDFPGTESLKQIYGTFNRAMLRRVPPLRGMAEPLTGAMIEFYTRSQNHFTSDQQPHYIYSPRELTRWKYAINAAIESVETVEDLVRLWAHEALRLFEDRLVQTTEKEWCQKLVDDVALANFPSVKSDVALERPILFSNYLTKNYISVQREELRKYITARLKIFYEEQLNVPIVVFDAVLDHILRIDRVLCQPLGHLLLVGASGVGKTTLTRFVAWMNNLAVFQIKAGRKYCLTDFDADLRDVMKRAGVKGERICFIFDESNVLSPAFLEKMNALLASGEIPGLFEGEEYMVLINQCREAQKVVDSDEQLYRNFIRNVQGNLHVVFTMNPANPDFSNRTASSPALFNRCVIDWFGDWSAEALWQVAKEFTALVDPPEASFPGVTQDNVNEQGTGQAQHEDASDRRQMVLVNTIVSIHNSVSVLNARMAKAAKKFNYITPRDFLDFIKHFVELHQTKKEGLVEQQLHLSNGLEKLKETEQQVLSLQQQLDIKQKELEQKQQQAQEKMKQMLVERTQAEKSEKISAELAIEVSKRQKVIEEREQAASKELEEAEPALKRAKESVSSIQKKDLNEIRSYKAPPRLVQLTLEALCTIITNTTKKTWDWNDLRQQVQKPTLIKDVIDFKTEDLKEHIKEAVGREYLDNKDWNVENIAKASGAAGPLAMWVQSQVRYATILKKVEPLKIEVNQLKKEGEKAIAEKTDLDKKVSLLQGVIQQLEKDYETLIQQRQQIEQEMKSVKVKVERSQNLLKNLSSERYRWDASAANFKHQMAALIGDVLVSAAFSSYIGFFDHFFRKALREQWRSIIAESQVLYRPDLSLIEYLSNPSERLLWHAQHHLPNDDLCTENAIILARFHRYPLVIDPDGQALEFILSYYRDRKIVRTSFVDDAFMKNLETALRFGCPLLVQDVERVDPILNSVLNKEIYKTGGRVLIRVGDTEIDFAPTFLMFMITRDASARFTPDLCSRVTFVNFTVTPSSLQNQCLNLFLHHEAPEIEEKRIQLMKLQGEYIVRLRELEDKLLSSLYNVQGSILENETVIATLENLKSEATVVQQKMDQQDIVIREVDCTTAQYVPLAAVCSQIFFALVSMNQVHYLYQFSLTFFMDTFIRLLTADPVLRNMPKTPNEALDRRRTLIFDLIFVKVYHRVANALLNQDKLIFLLRLLQIKLAGAPQTRDMHELFRTLILRGQTSNSGQEDMLSDQIDLTSINVIQGKLSKSKTKQLEELLKHPLFSNRLLSQLLQQEDRWLKFLDSSVPEDAIPHINTDEMDYSSQEDNLKNSSEMVTLLKNLALIKVFRPDRFDKLAHKLITSVLTPTIFSEDALQIDMKDVVANQSTAKSPILLCSAPGFDPSYKVEALSKELGVRLISVAIGSAEGFETAEQSINSAAKTGAWVLLKNVHLAPSWLSDLEKSIHRLQQQHSNFRLFLTMEFNPRVPATLILQSYKLVFEPPDGIKASLQRTYKTLLTPTRTDRLPRERAKMHFLLAWLHAVLLERMRYTPIGYTKVYEFNEADQRCALDLIDEFIDQACQQSGGGNTSEKTNLDPEKLPWEAIKVILTQNLYGGKIDNEYDSKILQSLVDHLFSINCFDERYDLFMKVDALALPIKMPEAIKQQQYVQWIEQLPEVESPAWSGLPSNAEKLLKEQQTTRILQLLWNLQDLNDEELVVDVHPVDSAPIKRGVHKGMKSQQQQQQQIQQPQWLVELRIRVQKQIELFQKHLPKLERTADSINDPLFRFLEREVTVGQKLLILVRQNLEEVLAVCEGRLVATSQVKVLAKELYNETVPILWKKYNVYALPASEWILDFQKRIQQFSQLISQKDGYQKHGVWLGHLLYPEAFLTATRQFVAQKHSWSLEELELKAELYQTDQPVSDDSFLVFGMCIEGAQWNAKTQALAPSDQISFPLGSVVFTWIRVTQQDKKNQSEENQEQSGEVLIPVYLNKSRKNLIFSQKMRVGTLQRSLIYQKAVALIAWNE